MLLTLLCHPLFAADDEAKETPPQKPHLLEHAATLHGQFIGWHSAPLPYDQSTDTSRQQRNP
jgi:hypothetical protein